MGKGCLPEGRAALFLLIKMGGWVYNNTNSNLPGWQIRKSKRGWYFEQDRNEMVKRGNNTGF